MNNSNSSLTLCIDTKKNRIRLSKSTIHQLGDPVMIQFLINPEERIAAILPQDHKVASSECCKVSLTAGNSAEIYSKSFIKELIQIDARLSSGRSYTMTGYIVQGEIAVFPFDCIVENET